jgi:hypothetical protein
MPISAGKRPKVAKSASRHFAEYGGGGASFCLPPYFTKDGAAGMKASFRGPAREPVSD